MAHAGMDYHVDFISLLSLSNIGTVEPELALTKKPTPAPEVMSGSHLVSNLPPSLGELPKGNNTPLLALLASKECEHNIKGGGVKRMRGQVAGWRADAECATEGVDLACQSKRECPENSHLRAYSQSGMFQSQRVPRPQISPCSGSMEMDTLGQSNEGSSVEQCNCVEAGNKRRVQFCTGLIEEVMSYSDTMLDHHSMWCSRCHCGESGHLDHLTTSSYMDTT